MKKLDWMLRVLLGQRCGNVAQFEIGQPVPNATGQIEVIVSYQGDVHSLETAGFLPSTVLPNPTTGRGIATGKVDVDRLEALAQIDNVVLISAPQSVSPLLNYSAQEIRARMAQQPNPSAYLGNGVVGASASAIVR